MKVMQVVLIPLDAAFPAVQAYLDERGDKPLDGTEVPVAAELLERCVRTSEALKKVAIRVAGRPCQQ